MQTWKLVDLPPNKISHWIQMAYKIEYQADGSIERYKARLVGKEYNQQAILIIMKLSLLYQKWSLLELL